MMRNTQTAAQNSIRVKKRRLCNLDFRRRPDATATSCSAVSNQTAASGVDARGGDE